MNDRPQRPKDHAELAARPGAAPVIAEVLRAGTAPAPVPDSAVGKQKAKQRGPKQRATLPDTSDESVQRLIMRELAEERGPVVFDEGDFYAYRDGVWTALDERANVWTAVQALNGVKAGNGKFLKVTSRVCESVVKLAQAAHTRPGWFEGAAPGLGFVDGFLRVTRAGLELVPHSEDHRSRHRFPFGYSDAMRAPCSRWLQALDEWGLSDAQRAFLAEWVGTCLIGQATVAGVAVVLVGEGGNGKSQCIEAINAMFPPDWCASVNMQDMGSRFRPAALVGKRLNSVADASGRDFLDTGAFKAVVTGDPITAERKHRDAFSFRPTAGHVFGLNELPRVADDSHGFRRRMVVVPFTRSFPPGATRVEDLGRKIAEAERAGMVGWALRGAAHRLAAGGFTPVEDDAVCEWMKDSNPVAQWLDERTTDEGDWTKVGALFADFRQWAERNGYRGVNRGTFGKRLKRLGVRARRSDGTFYGRTLVTS